MSEIESVTNEAEIQPEPDPIEVIHTGECESLSGRSTLSYAVGRHPDGTLHLRITGNTGGGMWCDEWVPGADIDAIVLHQAEVTSTSFQTLKPGRSTNTAGFVIAAVKSLGLIKTNAENTRLQDHVPTETFARVVMARIGEAAPKARRKREA